jgi:hypothetical protein
MTFRVSPGVYPRIINDSIQPNYVNPSIGAIVAGSRRGPLGPRHISTYKERVSLYGATDPSWGHGLDAIDAFLLQSNECWFNRVVSADATYAMGLISNNVIGGFPAGTSFTSIPLGSAVPFDQVNRDVQDLEFTGTFAAGHSIVLTINSVSSPSIPFTTDHNTTIEAIRQAAQNILDGIAAGGLAWTVPVGSNRQVIRLISPQAVTLTVSAAITGAGHPTYVAREADWLAFVVSENPGAWGNGVAAGIASVDTGIPQRITLSFSAAITSGATINATINGIALTPVVFTGNNDTTLGNLITAYTTAFPGGSGQVVTAGTPGSGARQVILIAPDSNTKLEVSVLTVTGGSGSVSTTWRQTLNNTPSTGAFSFVVYENKNFVNADETFNSTYADGVDGLGNPTGFAYIVNMGPRRSPRVRVHTNPFFSGRVYGVTNVTNSNYERYLAGGFDGALPSTQQVVTGWDDFANQEKITVRILINAGYSVPEVHQKMVAIAGARQDCIAILDVPSDQQDPQSAHNYRVNVADIDSWWGAMYSPDILIYDQTMGARRYVPPSGIVAGQYAYTDKVARSWYSPAGLTRGVIGQALGLRYTYEEGDRDLLSSAQVNVIRKYGSAWVIWGEYTLAQQMSALQSVGVVRLMIDVMTEAADVAAYSVFEPNTPFTWHRTRTRINAILAPIQNDEGITDFYVQCDASNNTPDVIDQRVMKIAMWIKPVLSALYIQLDGIVTRQSAVFSLEMAAANNQF